MHEQDRRGTEHRVNEEHPSLVDVSTRAEDPFSCSVCMEIFSIDLFPLRSITDACNHETTACLTCLQQSIEVQFRDRFWKSIGCPVCNVPMEYKDIRDFGTKAVFERCVTSSCIDGTHV